ncbi:hypothetical protein [Chromobacterium phragmitis]|uniref:hypothetical protein n=1 Tax=Chromobacterium phragmitis TaxID=2202141 RepID=UPI00387827E2
MMEHTKEPWRADGRYILPAGADHHTVAIASARSYGEDGTDAERDANARRIVACVNALAHISTEQLESGEMLHVGQALADVTRQRDQLLAALEALLAVFEYQKEPEKIEAVKQARAAIITAKERS